MNTITINGPGVPLLIRGGRLVSPDGITAADLLLRDGRIAAILAPSGHPARPPDAPDAPLGTEVLDATGHLVFPGFIDPHIHSRQPGGEHKETFAHSTRAARAGGITTVIEMPNTIPPLRDTETLACRVAEYEATAEIDFGLWGILLGDETPGDLAAMVDSGAAGFKSFWGYALDRRTNALVYNLDDVDPDDLVPPPATGAMLAAFDAAARVGGLIAAHCEDRGVLDAAAHDLGRRPATYADLLAIRPAAAEALAISLGARMALLTGGPFHVVHVSSAAGVAAVRAAKAEGAPITAETCPQYLFLTDREVASLGPRAKAYPLTRTAADRDALWAAVTDGTIDILASDHAPHAPTEKASGWATAPAGTPGVETLAPLTVDAMCRGMLTPERTCSLLATGAARIFGLQPRKGSLAVGTDADVCLVDPSATWTLDETRLHSLHPSSSWHGRAMTGRITHTIARGRVVARDGRAIGDASGRGRFIASRR